MFDDAALALEEIAPEDKNRNDPPLHQFHRGEAVGQREDLVAVFAAINGYS